MYKLTFNKRKIPLKTNRRAFSLLELVVAIGIISLLMAILLVTLEKVRHKGYIVKCAANLQSIGQAMVIYGNENHGAYPRTRYKPGAPLTAGTGAASLDFFSTTGPDLNDVTAAIYLLIRTEKLPPLVFICPYNDITSYTPDLADPSLHANFTDFRKNLSYAFADMYPGALAESVGYRWDGKLSAKFALASDIGPTTITPGLILQSSTQLKMQANSPNHEYDGQNVLYADGHVSWEVTMFAGVDGDAIFINRAGAVGGIPADANDSVLVPTR